MALGAQTRDHAWAVIRREAIIRRVNPVHMDAFIGEAVLHQRIGGDPVMRKQFAFLGELAARPNISIRIVPLDTDWHPGMKGLLSVSVFADRNPLVFTASRSATGV